MQKYIKGSDISDYLQLPEKYTLFQLAAAMRMANEKWKADDEYKDDLNIVLQRIFEKEKKC